MSKQWEREVRIFAVAALLLLMGLFVALDGAGRTNHAIRAFLARAGKQRAVSHIKQHYPSAVIVDAGLVNIAWGEVGEWTIIFEVNHTCYHAWYSLDGATQTGLITYPRLAESLCHNDSYRLEKQGQAL
jgi:hypothetical protein